MSKLDSFNKTVCSLRVMIPFLKCLAGGRRTFHDLSVGETAARRSRECGGGKTPPQISCRKDQAGSLGTQEKVSLPD